MMHSGCLCSASEEGSRNRVGEDLQHSSDTFSSGEYFPGFVVAGHATDPHTSEYIGRQPRDRQPERRNDEDNEASIRRHERDPW